MPKEVETPAESRAVAKPEIKPELPEKPPIVSPKPAEPAIPPPDTPPALKPPAKPDEAKPAAPKKPQDDPFGSNDANKPRLWTDASGKYHIEARFVSYADDTVRLQAADGRYYRIKFDRLSASDQDFVLHQDGSLFAAE